MPAAYLVNEEIGREYVQPGCSVEQIKIAIELYPGPLELDEININQSPERVFSDSITAAKRDGDLLATSLLITLISLRWHSRETNSQASIHNFALEIPELLHPERSMNSETNSFSGELTTFTNKLFELVRLPTGSRSEKQRTLVESAQSSRNEFQRLRSSVDKTIALKHLHDALHYLQVGTDSDQRNNTVQRQSLTKRLKTTSDEIAGAFNALDHSGRECLERSRRVLDNTRLLLERPGGDHSALAMHCLRRLFRNEMYRLDYLLFAAVCEWPLRKIVKLMIKGMDLGFGFAPENAILMHSSLLRRILVHSVWQDVDFRLYAIEEAIQRGHPSWISDLWQEVRSISHMLACLDKGTGDLSLLSSQLSIAVTNYEADQGPKGISRIHNAVTELARVVRFRFREVDIRLKADLQAFLSLGPSLDQLIDELP